MAARTTRSRLIRISTFALFVSVVSLLAATATAFIACARFDSLLAQGRIRGQLFLPSDGWPWTAMETLGASAVHMLSPRESVAEFRAALLAEARVPQRETPWWLSFCSEEPRRPVDGFGPRFWSHAFGWPLPALARTLNPNPAKGGWARFGGSPDSPWIAGGVFGWPTEIIWPGLLFNIAFFAALFATPPVTFRIVRARHRRRRGACLSCGYDRQGLAVDGPCPECGPK